MFSIEVLIIKDVVKVELILVNSTAKLSWQKSKFGNAIQADLTMAIHSLFTISFCVGDNRKII